MSQRILLNFNENLTQVSIVWILRQNSHKGKPSFIRVPETDASVAQAQRKNSHKGERRVVNYILISTKNKCFGTNFDPGLISERISLNFTKKSDTSFQCKNTTEEQP